MKPLFFTPVMALLLLAAAPAHAASDADVTIIKAENVVIGGNMIVSVTGFGYFYPKRNGRGLRTQRRWHVFVHR